MKAGRLAGGIILLIIAVIGFTNTTNSVTEKQSSLGQVERFLSQDAQNSYQANSMGQMIFAVLGIVGLGLTISGAVASGKPKQGSMFRCKYCLVTRERYEDIRSHMSTCSSKPKTSSENDDVKNLGILKKRLAKGEISKKEYDELKKEFET